jgi:predicted nucleic acid-binding protein
MPSDPTRSIIPDAYFAALAIEHDCEWATTDRDYARFPDLKLLAL